MSLNKVQLIGNVGKQPEIRYTSDGKPIATISVATSEKWKDKNTGEKQERTEWHRVVAFGQPAGFIGQYIDKGSRVYIEGKLRTRKYQDESGQDRWSTEVFVDVVQSLDSRQDNSKNEQEHGQAPQQPQADALDDDIPF